jgi:hypothetical protein
MMTAQAEKQDFSRYNARIGVSDHRMSEIGDRSPIDKGSLKCSSSGLGEGKDLQIGGGREEALCVLGRSGDNL